MAATASLARADGAINLPSRDGAIVLTDLGGGKASFFCLLTDGNRAVKQKLWTGRLPVAATRYVVGDLNADPYADVAALVKLSGGRCRLLLFTGNGRRLRQNGAWTGRLSWAAARLSIGFFVPGQTRDIGVTVRNADGSGRLMLFRAGGTRLAAPDVMALPAGIPVGATMTSGDVNGDYHDELVFFGAADTGGSRLCVYVNVNGFWELQKTADGTLTTKGAQISCGDVDADGIAEVVALSGGMAVAVTTFECDGDTVQSTSVGGPAIGIPSVTCKLGVADMNGDARADLVTLQRRDSRRCRLRVAVSGPDGFASSTFWTGRLSYARSRFACASSLPVRVRDNIHALSVDAVAGIVSAAEDGSTVTFAGTPAEVTALRQGDVVIAEPTTVIPNGIMCKVQTVVSADGQTVLTATPATLEDVFSQVEIDVSGVSQPADGQAGAPRRTNLGTAPTTHGALGPIKVPFDLKKTFTEGDAKAIVGYQGELALTLRCDCWVKIEVDWWYVVPTNVSVKCRMALGFDETLTSRLFMEGKASFPWKQDLYEHHFTVIPFGIGPVPCWLDPYVGLELRAGLTVKERASVKVVQHMSGTLGAEYDDGWKNLTDATFKIDTPTVEFSANADAKIGIYATGGARIYSVFGPEVSFGPYLRGHAGLTENPQARLFAGVEANAGVKLKIPFIGKKWDHSFGPWTLWEKELWHSPISGGPVDEELFTSCSNYFENWARGPVSLNFQVFCTGQSYEKTMYNLDGAGWQKMPLASREHPALTVTGEGDHVLEYRSYAFGGEIEDIKTMHVRIDMTTPTLTCVGPDPVGAASWRSDPAAVHLVGADEGGSGVNYIDLYVNGVPVLFTDPEAFYTVAVDGDNILSWDIYDGADNHTRMQLGELKLDLLPPITVVSGADDDWHLNPVALTFTASDLHGKVEGSGVAYTEYRLGLGGVFGPWTRGTAVVVSGNGDHEVQYRSVDNVGHVEDAGSVHAKIDETGGDGTPPITTVSPYYAGWNRAPVTLTFSATDPQPGTGVEYTEYKVDSASWMRGTSVTIDRDGDHTVMYRSADSRGNVEQANTCRVKVDRTAPSCAANGADNSWHAAPVTVTFTGTDPSPGSGLDRVEYSVDDGPWIAGSSVTLPDPPQTITHDYTVRYRAVDVAGNVGIVGTVHVKVDTDGQAPTCVISGADDTWHNTSVSLTFSATDPAEGSLPTEYRIDGASWIPGDGLTIDARRDHGNDGIHLVECRATDQTGMSDVVRCQVKIDTVAPHTTASGYDPGTWSTQPVSLTLASNDTDASGGHTIQTSGIDHVDAAYSPGTSWLLDDPVTDVAWAGATAWCVGGQRRLGCTTDGGLTWQSPPTVPDLDYLGSIIGIECPTPDTVWIFGNRGGFGVMAISRDGGVTWAYYSTLINWEGRPIHIMVWDPGLLACQPGNPDRAWYVGDLLSQNRYVVGTPDGGATWTKVSDYLGRISDITCAADGSLWVVNLEGQIFHTPDGGITLNEPNGGITWNEQTQPLGEAEFFQVTCLNDQIAWACTTDGRVVRTSNGGLEWTEWTGLPQGGLFEVVPVNSEGTRLVGLGGDGFPVWQSSDSGSSWSAWYASDTVESLGISTGHPGIAFRDGEGGLAWDGRGRTLRFDDRPIAELWRTIGQGSGQDGERLVTNLLVDATLPSFVTWKAVDRAGNVEVPASPTKILIDRTPPYTRSYGAVPRDNLGGSGLPSAQVSFPTGTWFEYMIPYWPNPKRTWTIPFDALCCGYREGQEGMGGRLAAALWHTNGGVDTVGVEWTDDGGTNWHSSTISTTNNSYTTTYASSIACATTASATRHYVLRASHTPSRYGTHTYDVVSYSSDGGRTWSSANLATQTTSDAVPLARALGCPAHDVTRAWAVGTGGRIWKTSDGGVTWAQTNPTTTGQPSTYDLNAVCASSATRAWAVGANGVILSYDGSAWRSESSPTTTDLVSVSCALARDKKWHVWAVGASDATGGVIVHGVIDGNGAASWSSQAYYPRLTDVSCGADSVFFSDGSRIWRRTLSSDDDWSGWVDISKSRSEPGFKATGLMLAAEDDFHLYAAGTLSADNTSNIWTTLTATPQWIPALPDQSGSWTWDWPQPGITYQYFSQDIAGNQEPIATWTEPAAATP